MFSSCFILPLKGNVRLVSVSCGSQNVWAVDHRGIVYFRVGTQPLNPSMMLPAWIHIEPPAQVRHAAGPDGSGAVLSRPGDRAPVSAASGRAARQYSDQP